MRQFSVWIGVMAAVALAGCSQDRSVSERIAAEAAKAQTLDLAALTPFPWDSALVFGPYASTERICAALPPSFSTCATAYPHGVDEGSYLLAFVRDGHVVHHELHARRNGEFCRDSCVLELKPREARFTVGPSSTTAGRKQFTQEAR